MTIVQDANEPQGELHAISPAEPQGYFKTLTQNQSSELKRSGSVSSTPHTGQNFASKELVTSLLIASAFSAGLPHRVMERVVITKFTANFDSLFSDCSTEIKPCTQEPFEHSLAVINDKINYDQTKPIRYFEITCGLKLNMELHKLGYLVERNSIDGLNAKSMWSQVGLAQPFIPEFTVVNPEPQEPQDAQGADAETQASPASA